MSNNLEQIYLNSFYNNSGARFVPFSGYSMPINFSNGIIKENLHTRTKIGIFDVSHMGQMLIPYKSDNINKLKLVIPHNLDHLNQSQCVYSFILNAQGGVVDDLIISKVLISKKEYFFLVYNCSRKKIDQDIILNLVSDAKIILNNSLLALQGPISSNIIDKLIPETQNLNFMKIISVNYNNEKILISRSGYTGEDGFEISIPNTIVLEFIEKLISFDETMLCGLGSRDSLRLEAGLCLYGNELNENISPIQANLEWAIPKSIIKNGNFNGRKRILNEINNGLNKKLVGIKSTGKFILRQCMTLHNHSKTIIGEITSGGFSPSLNTSIAMAYVDSIAISESTIINCLVRNKMEEVQIVTLPFIKHKYKKG